MFFWNVNGNLSYRLSFKTLVSKLSQYDVIVFIETKLSRCELFSMEHLGYTIIGRNDRTTSSGGVLIAVRTKFVSHARIVLNQPGRELILVSFFDQFVLGAVYIPPRESPFFDTFDRFENLADAIGICSSSSVPYVIVGDLNSRFGQRTQTFTDMECEQFVHHIKNSDVKLNTSGRELLQLCDSLHSVIMTGKCWDNSYTCSRYNGMSTVDTGLCSLDMLDRVSSGRTIDLSEFSDHSAISFHVRIQSKSSASDNGFSSRSVVSKIRLLRAMQGPNYANMVSSILNSDHFLCFKQELDSIFESKQSLSKGQLTDLVSRFYSSFESILHKVFPKRQLRAPNRRTHRSTDNGTLTVLYDKACKASIRAYRQAKRMLRRHYCDKNLSLLLTRRRIRNSHVRRCRRTSESLFLRTLFLSCNSTQLWNAVKPRCNDPYNGPVSVESLTLHLRDIAEGKYTCCERLSISAQKHLTANQFMSSLPVDVEDRLIDSFPIKDILQPKLGKAVGLDGWSGELIRFLSEPLSSVIPKLFVLCLRSGCTPSQWDSDVKIPVLKPGRPPELVGSLRPILHPSIRLVSKKHTAVLLGYLFCVPLLTRMLSKNNAQFLHAS